MIVKGLKSRLNVTAAGKKNRPSTARKIYGPEGVASKKFGNPLTRV